MQFAKLSCHYPLGCESTWSYTNQLNDNQLNEWLLHTGSLTERLKQRCNEFRVEVIGENRAELSHSEAQLLNCDEPYIAREVLLICDEQPWVFARSLLPESLVNEHLALANLGNKPLGTIIFNDPNMLRTPFQVANFDNDSDLCHKLGTAMPVSKTLWGRRSLFTRDQHKLMVAEIFLPHSPVYQ